MKKNYIKPFVTVDKMLLSCAVLDLSNANDYNASGNGTTNTGSGSGTNWGVDKNEDEDYVETAKKRNNFGGSGDSYGDLW